MARSLRRGPGFVLAPACEGVQISFLPCRRMSEEWQAAIHGDIGTMAEEPAPGTGVPANAWSNSGVRPCAAGGHTG